MKNYTRKVTTTTVKVYFDEDEIKEMILAKSGMETGEVVFDEASYGGILGCWVKKETTVEEEE